MNLYGKLGCKEWQYILYVGGRAVHKNFETFLRKSSRGRKATNAGFERAKIFSWDRTAKLTVECYRKVLGV